MIDGLEIKITIIGNEFEIYVNDEDASVKDVINLLNNANSHILTSFYSLVGDKINSRNYENMLKSVKINQILND